MRTFGVSSIFLSLGLTLLVSCGGKGAAPDSETGLVAEVSAKIKLRLEKVRGPYTKKIMREPIRAKLGLSRAYAMRGYRAAWISEKGALPQVAGLIRSIRDSQADGLNPQDFHLTAIQALIDDWTHRIDLEMLPNVDRIADLDMLMTDSFLTLAAQYDSGRVKPKESTYEWYIPRKDHKNPADVFYLAIESNTVAESLKELLPREPVYWQLRSALSTYRKIATSGGWKLIPPGPALKLGDTDKRVQLLRRRLFIEGDYKEASPPIDPLFFDRILQLALQRFQERHGISPTGILDASTLKALNVSAPKRVRQIEVNLERWRWLPRDFGKKHIAVNIANYELTAVEDEEVFSRMAVVVGNQYRQTPVFTGTMTHVVLNPYWFIPKNIVFQDLLPKLKKDAEYLAKHRISVVEKDREKNHNDQWKIVDPALIDWTSAREDAFTYSLRQDPGPGNSLGQVKFMFPNSFSIYLHDTPAKDLFKKGARGLSSGCIRLSKPMELLEFVLGDDWDSKAIAETLKAGQETELQLKTPVPVHMLYQTAWADHLGIVYFRPDIYGQDELLEQFL